MPSLPDLTSPRVQAPDPVTTIGAAIAKLKTRDIKLVVAGLRDSALSPLVVARGDQ